MSGYQIEGRTGADEPWLRFAFLFTDLAETRAAVRELRDNAVDGWPEYRVVEVPSGAELPEADS